MKNIDKEIENLSEKAKNCDDSNDALKFSQAALNLAHTQATMKNLKNQA